tara:strand:+ start:4833 stop:4970 length:138 start_codon:yes stop_codon:yes gene_type:complete
MIMLACIQCAFSVAQLIGIFSICMAPLLFTFKQIFSIKNQGTPDE